MIAGALFLFTFVVSGVAAAAAASRVLGDVGEGRRAVLAAVFACGPSVVSWLYVLLLRLSPGIHWHWQIVIILGAVLLLLLFGRRELVGILDAAVAAKNWALRAASTRLSVWLAVVLAAVLGLSVTLSVLLPPSENDALQYLIISRMITERAEVGFYPVTEPDPQTGFYAVSSHPLGLMGLYAWLMTVAGGEAARPLLKLVSPMHVLYTVSLLGVALRARPARDWLFASLLVVLTPIYLSQAVTMSIDAYRLALYLAAAVATIELARLDERRETRAGWLVGALWGFSMFTHSINMALTPVLLGAGYVFASKAGWPRRFQILIYAGIAGALIAGWRIVDNLIKFGVPIYDSVKVFAMRSLEYGDYRSYLNRFVEESDRWLHGWLRGFTDLEFYSFAFWPFAAYILTLVIRRRFIGPDRALEIVMLATLGGFGALAALTLALQSEVFVNNARYMLSVLPAAGCLGALFLGWFYERATAHR